MVWIKYSRSPVCCLKVCNVLQKLWHVRKDVFSIQIGRLQILNLRFQKLLIK
jgi:hypothetical protein